MGELFGALGLAWPRLLLYPGGLFALVASWLLGRWLARCGGVPHGPAAPLLPDAALEFVPPLVALSLLPLAPARAFPYGLDLPVTLALLEWPRARVLASDARTPAELVRDYGLLLVAVLAMTVAVGGLELTRLLRWPAAWPAQALLASGAALWLLALPRLISGGPPGPAGALRTLGLLLVATLPVLGALAAETAEHLPAGLAGWLLPPLAIVVVALALGALLRMPRQAQGWIAGSLVALVLLLAGYAASTVR
ncbi:MAG: hypothetical protein HXY37_18180 [Chloroflexi bacterium]|nr:hypothetical protein [Chloroflexota bacterium]